MELIHFAIASVALMLAWRFVLRRALLDDARDKLFDCRDRLRSTFIENGWSLDGEGYKSARDSVNSHLRFIEDISVWKIVVVQGYLKDKPEVVASMQKKTDELFTRLPEEQAKFVKSLRQETLHTVMEFAISTSVFLVVMTVMVLPFVFLRMVCRAMTRGFFAFFKLALRSLRDIRNTTHNIAETAGLKVADMVLNESVVEQFSLQHRRFA